MTFLALLKHRKSVRDFLNRPVERDKIMTCLEAARLANSLRRQFTTVEVYRCG